MVIQEDNRWKVVILFKKKKKTAHVYFEHRIFLSFLAGKFDAFEQILLTEPVMKKLEHAYFFLFFLTTLNIILNCPTKSQNIICLSFSP